VAHKDVVQAALHLDDVLGVALSASLIGRLGDRVEVTLSQMGVASSLNPKDQPQSAHAGGDESERHLTVLTIPARLKRTGIEMRIGALNSSFMSKSESHSAQPL
jgi:hypothetical protein